MSNANTQRAAPLWRLTLLGGLAVEYGDRRTAHFETRRAAALLACLGFYRHRRHTREALIEMLWPDEDLEATRLRFRQVLTSLRKTCASLHPEVEPFLMADRTFVFVDTDRVTTDVAEFEAMIQRAARQQTAQARAAALGQAIQLYRGELLPGHYEDWVGGERQILAESYLSALTNLAELQRQLGDTTTATELIRKALVIDPLREESHRCLIQLHASAGRNAEALMQYREMEQALWKELRIIPSASSQALIEQVRAGKLSAHSIPAAMPDSRATIRVEVASTLEQAPAGQSQPTDPAPTLAAPLTPFFGRETEIRWLIDQLKPAAEIGQTAQANAIPGQEIATRLVTLTGIGGCGKTRLALETARHLQGSYHNAVWFVPLAAGGGGALVAAVTDVVCGPNARADGSLQQAITVLAHRPALLILDNFEQMALAGQEEQKGQKGQDSGRMVRALLEHVPTLKCLITSRQRLDIEGEREYPLTPLPIPSQNATPEQLLGFASVRLFLDRVQRARPGFVMAAGMAEAIAAICAQLEGIPLALELAAAWMALLSPAQMRERLKQRFDLLVSRRKDIPERHRSMRATLEWSYRNLAPEQQRFFARLAVFHGGWTLEAAEAVCATPEALDHLAQLQHCSFIQAEETPIGMRFNMLDLLREFAAEQLSEEERLDLERRHRACFLALAERAAPQLTGADQRDCLLRLKYDYGNLRHILTASETPQGDREMGLRLFLALWRFWDVYRHYPEGEQWALKLKDRLFGITPVWKASLLEAGGNLICNLGHSQRAGEMLEEALSLYRAQGDRQGIARVLCGFAIAVRDAGDYQRAHQLFAEALPMLKEMGDPFFLGRVLAGVAVLYQKEENYAAALPMMEEAAAMYRISGHKKGLAFCLNGQGTAALEAGDLEAARSFLLRALALARNIDDAEQIQYALYRLGNIHYLWRDHATAQEYFREARSHAVATGAREWEALFLIWLGAIECETSDYLKAEASFRTALTICEAGDFPACRAALVQRIAVLAASQGHVERALRLLSAGSTRGGEASSLFDPLRILPQVDAESLKRDAGAEKYERAWEQGRTWPWEQVIHDAKEEITTWMPV